MFQLKGYQQRALEDLRRFLRQASVLGPKHAFIALTDRPYFTVPRLPEPPYVCTRIPTGGGKTLVACHAVAIAACEYVQADRIVALWLVPSNAILEQTLAALRNRQHAYRQALEATLTGPVTVMNLAEALALSRGTMAADHVVIVSTLAALRVEDTEGRKIYETNGSLLAHFDGLTLEERARLEQDDPGRPRVSLANVLRLHRPIVVMDEAHNARTPLSFEALERFDPAVILEFTATPALEHDPARGRFGSNVLHHCSARELKVEEMIKLPIELRAEVDWQAALAAAVEQQKALEELAAREESTTGQYLRPIVLIQAERRSGVQQTVDVDRVQEVLITRFGVPPEHVAVEAYDTHDLEGVDVLARDCPVRFVITQQKLREGWDCPFAYVLASVAEQHSATAVEQILGRILRMPYQRRRHDETLNRGYAFVSSPRFQEAAGALRDALVTAGFERLEAQDFILSTQATIDADLPLFRRTPSEERTFPPLLVPGLAIRRDKQLELLEADHLLGLDWTLTSVEASLSDAEFPANPSQVQDAEIDIDAQGKLQTYLRPFEEHLHRQTRLLGVDEGWTAARLAVWLDRNLPERQDLTQRETLDYLSRLAEWLVEERKLDITHLGHHRYRLLRAVSRKIAFLRLQAAGQTFDRLLAGEAEEKLAVDPATCFELSADRSTRRSRRVRSRRRAPSCGRSPAGRPGRQPATQSAFSQTPEQQASSSLQGPPSCSHGGWANPGGAGGHPMAPGAAGGIPSGSPSKQHPSRP